MLLPEYADYIDHPDKDDHNLFLEKLEYDWENRNARDQRMTQLHHWKAEKTLFYKSWHDVYPKGFMCYTEDITELPVHFAFPKDQPVVLIFAPFHYMRYIRAFTDRITKDTIHILCVISCMSFIIEIT